MREVNKQSKNVVKLDQCLIYSIHFIYLRIILTKEKNNHTIKNLDLNVIHKKKFQYSSNLTFLTHLNYCW